jgi:hypothetical protein
VNESAGEERLVTVAVIVAVVVVVRDGRHGGSLRAKFRNAGRHVQRGVSERNGERRVRLFIMQNTPRAPNNPKLSEAG